VKRKVETADFKKGLGAFTCSGWLFAAAVMASPAQAADPIIAMTQFGLLGTWDHDCTHPITDAMLLIRFTETSLGMPRMIVTHPDEIMYETTVDAAALIPPDEIKLTLDSGLGPPQQLIFRLTEGALQPLTTPPLPSLHRCVSE
jgi:hypothetical protein